jgi:hypothetical protein
LALRVFPPFEVCKKGLVFALSSVITNNSYLYSLGSSPICVHEVEKSLSFYPFGNVKTELIQGLKHGFKGLVLDL